MIRLRQLPRALSRDSRGAAALEFALIGPLMIAMLLGVMQIGLAMQAYSSLRSASADVARYSAVQYQKDNEIDNTAIQTFARTTATSLPYGLKSANLTVTVTQPTTQRVIGAKELTLAYSYNVPNILNIIQLGTIPLSFSRPIFVQDD